MPCPSFRALISLLQTRGPCDPLTTKQWASLRHFSPSESSLPPPHTYAWGHLRISTFQRLSAPRRQFGSSFHKLQSLTQAASRIALLSNPIVRPYRCFVCHATRRFLDGLTEATGTGRFAKANEDMISRWPFQCSGRTQHHFCLLSMIGFHPFAILCCAPVSPFTRPAWKRTMAAISTL